MNPHRESAVLVIIPAFNEEASLERVVSSLKAGVPQAEIAVINDGSRDGTGALIDRLGVIALHLPRHVGVGAAEQAGFRYALEKGYEWVVRNDGDGQHNPQEIPLLLDALRTTECDVVVGSRYLEDRGYVTPRARRLGILVLAAVVSLVCRRRFTDPTSGFRAFNRRAVRLCARTYPDRYPEAQALVRFVRAGLRVREIPVTMNPRYGGKSSIQLRDSAAYMLRVLLAIAIDLLHPAPSLPGGDSPSFNPP